MSVTLINPPELARAVGYSHGALGQGRTLALAGQIGWDEKARLVSTELAPQFEQALANLVATLRAAGGRPEDLVSLRIYVTDKRRYLAARGEIGAAYRRHLGRHFPAMALVQVADLLEDGALVEIEGLAVLPESGAGPGAGPAAAPGTTPSSTPGTTPDTSRGTP
ncbi:MAG TPA: RidA family protein [Polyangia bacterium]|jgi:enamine deaminase RidA (YjgF/YER057c/UK114 family)|nr:RidA family protein [Polyangia bacterium]